MSVCPFRLQAPRGVVRAGAVLALLAASGRAHAAGNPLDYDGAHFLGLYVPLMFASLVAAVLLRRLLRVPAADARLRYRLDDYETAYLAGDADRAVDTALVVLAQRGQIEPGLDGCTLQARGRPSLQDGTERKVLGALTLAGRPAAARRRARLAIRADFDARLRPQGLVLTMAQATLVRVLPALCTGTVLGFGLLKLAIGLSRDRPVGFLAVCCIGLGIATLVLLLKSVHRSRRADALLEELRAGLKPRSLASMHDPRLGLAAALFGVAAISHLLPDALGALLAPVGSGDGGSGDGGSDSDGGGDGGGGGCGGCGGGGD